MKTLDVVVSLVVGLGLVAGGVWAWKKWGGVFDTDATTKPEKSKKATEKHKFNAGHNPGGEQGDGWNTGDAKATRAEERAAAKAAAEAATLAAVKAAAGTAGASTNLQAVKNALVVAGSGDISGRGQALSAGAYTGDE